MKAPVKIAIVDDMEMSHQAIRWVLRFINNAVHSFSAYSSTEFFEKINRHKTDLVLLDIKFPDEEPDGLEILAEIKVRHSHLKVLMTSVYDENFYINKARALGANGFLLKNFSPEDLKRYIEKAMEGKFVLSDEIKLEEKVPANNFSVNLLTKTEIQVANRICHGLSRKETAGEMNISPSTVKNHLTNIFSKLGVKNSLGLMIFARENQWWEFVQLFSFLFFSG